ncbi:T9SS type A sorting domain-containing protein [Christiangramia sabulilitoris]|uniref:T9SS type A sorting domain-containing protein n=1 Tax=Christiangramia sabulilitoris TaxID=2583991 RepID=A0A550I6A9_9FLAO|nr:T9SS type A sorting domain-containing protein [Christiangramia sabulilitoris]TRO66514.1 T9SS type A sorting domain-containing protein [Christiangramia sabulilitoris]
MSLSYQRLNSLFGLALLLVIFIVPATLNAQAALEIGNERYTIQENFLEEFSQVTLSKNSSILEVNGTLIVQGDLRMDGNFSTLIMGPNARVIVFGDFFASNQIELNVSSYLIIYGNFIKKGSDTQGDLNVENANIYIYGTVENWGDDFQTCGGQYDGNTGDIQQESCDYGTEDDFENNRDDFPEDLVDLVNCYNLTAISDQTACIGGTATFSVAESLNISAADVTFRWQKKVLSDGTWEDIPGATNSEYVISPVTAELGNNFYRVIVKPTPSSSSNCKISISRNVILNVQEPGIWTGAVDTNWNNSANWSCDRLPGLDTDVLIPENLSSGNYPVVNPGANALANDLEVQNSASLEINSNWLRITGNLSNQGVLDTENGSISFEGTNTQIIPVAAFQNNRVLNLRINNPAGVSSEALIEVTGTLNPENGVFQTGDKLTLISDATQTALISGNGNGEVLGLVNMQRFLDKAFGYKYFSSPFKNSTVGDFIPYIVLEDAVSGFPHFYRYEENRTVSIDGSPQDATGWLAYTETGNSLNISEGYALNFGSSFNEKTIELTGEVNNGLITARLLENNHGEYTKGFHLVGNPYPSPIDWNSAEGWTRTNIDDGIYFFNASDTDQYSGTYTAYVNNISTGSGETQNIIPSMQGYFIKVSDSETKQKVTGNFGMDNRVRITDFNQNFYKNQLLEQPLLLRLEAGFVQHPQSDALVIYFTSSATEGFEKELDAHKLWNTDPTVPSFYNLTENQNALAINAIPYPDYSDYRKIPLGLRVEENGEMNINMASIENLSPNLNIYLIDHIAGVGQNLRSKPNYKFNITKGVHDSRFELMFSEKEVTNPAIAFNLPFEAKVQDGNIIVNLNLEKDQKGNLRLSTITGQILITRSGTGKEQIIFQGIKSAGVYIISLQTGQSQYSRKLIIRN